MKYVTIFIVGSLAVACGSRGKSPSYAAQGERMIQLGGADDRHSIEHSRFSARLILAPQQTRAAQRAEPF
jgi:hypothetical protein